MSSSPAPDPGIKALFQADSARPVALLHSGRPHPRWARRSLLGTPAVWFRHTADGRSELIDARSDADRTAGDTPLPELSHSLVRDLRLLLNCAALPSPPGAWVGYFGYDLARVVEPGRLADMQRSDWPIVELGYCPVLTELPVGDPPTPPSAPREMVTPPEHWRRDFGRAEYERTVQRVIDYISAGDVFQVNLAQRFVTEYVGDPRQLFARLASISPAWYGAYLECGVSSDGPATPGRALLSTSPELFLQLDARHVTTRPIKGTRPVSTDAGGGEVDPNREVLLHSEKDTAELNMIVDLLRNDLGRVCDYGTVRVTEPRTIETHPTIHHATATIEGELHESMDVVDLIRATMPGGSITGAPKVRAMQIIDELEPVPRGPYCGAIGYLTRESACLNIAIRTMALTRFGEADRYEVSFHVGGGIVADSTPAGEYDETLAKARAMVEALRPS